MKPHKRNNVYRSAYEAASLELAEIVSAYEQLSEQKNRIELEALRKQREAEKRPCLTIDKLGPVIRQVVNDARQNKAEV